MLQAIFSKAVRENYVMLMLALRVFDTHSMLGAPYTRISKEDLYELLHLRCVVFVVEQSSAFLEVDGLDPTSFHLLCRETTNEGLLVGYARLRRLPELRALRLERVVVAPKVRRNGLGTKLISFALAVAEEHLRGERIDLSAQEHLVQFYEKFGFRPHWPGRFEEGNVFHVPMSRSRGDAQIYCAKL